METNTVKEKLEAVAQRVELGVDLAVYEPDALEAITEPLEEYVNRPKPSRRRSWLPWRWGSEKPTRVAPLLLSGPVGTGKTTLMMLLDRALPEASCSSLFQQEIPAHPSTADGGGPALIEVHPLPLMGQTRNLPTGVVRLRELQTFYRRFTYDRATAREDREAAERFAQLFHRRIVFVDEFVPDVVSSFPMQVINHLADHGVQLVLSSNRRETPFVEGVQVVPIEGADMRTGDLSLVCRPAGPDARFDAFHELLPHTYDHIARGLKARVRAVAGEKWMHLCFEDVARSRTDWLAFQHLLQFSDRLLVDEVPVFDPSFETEPDAVRRFVFLIDALYDERHPVLLRLTNDRPLPPDFEVEQLSNLYLPENIIDLERALSRLRQLSMLVDDATRTTHPSSPP